MWNDPTPLSRCSFRFESYVDGLQRLGHDPVVVCARAADDGFPVPTWTVERQEDLDRPATWHAAGADAAFVVTWLRMSKTLEALREAGVRTVAITDSDGQVGSSAQPRALLRYALAMNPTARAKARVLAAVLREIILHRVRLSNHDREHLASTRASDVVVFGHRRGAECFAHFLRHHGHADLRHRIAIVPPAVHEIYTRVPVGEHRSPRLVAVGRWDSVQKNAPLLAAALALALRQRPLEVDLFGVGGTGDFGPLQQRFSGVSIHGAQNPDVVARSMSSSRSIVFASRWEGAPHAAAEALASGATVVGTPIPCFQSCADEGAGTVARRSSPSALAAAILDEMQCWDRGERDAARISEEWRQRVSGEGVCRSLLGALERGADPASLGSP